MDSSSVLNFSSFTCRVCLQDHEQSNSLLDMVQYEDGKQMEIREILQIICKTAGSFECGDSTDSGLAQKPARICAECTEKLFNAYDLLRLIEHSEQVLSTALFSTDCIEEEPEEAQQQQTTDEIVEQVICIDQNLVEEEEEDDEEETADDDDGLERTPVDSENLEVLDEEYQIINHETGQIEIADEQPNDDGYVQEFIVCDLIAEQGKTDSDEEQNLNPVRATKKRTGNTRRYEIGSRLTNTENANWHKCKYCKRSFAKSETYDKHMRTAHPQTPLVKIENVVMSSKPDEQPISCPHCPRLFARPDNLKRHLKAVHSAETTEDADGSSNTETNDKRQHKYKRCLCPFCGQSFSQASLAVHIRRHTGENPYKCNNKDCQKAFPRRQDLIIHQRQHTGERPHVCTVCGKSFMRPNKLTRHLRIHTGHRPYKCTECDKTFSQSNDLKIHLRRHSGEKPYRCGVCGEGFICGTKLKSHRKLKSHYADEDEQQPVDPYAKCRVINRNNSPIIVNTKSTNSGSADAAVIIQDFKEFY